MDYSKLLSCAHCGNKSKMEIIGSVYHDQCDVDPEMGAGPDQGTHYSILKCPACEKINIVSYFWHEAMGSEEDVTYEILYPQLSDGPIGLPDKVKAAYEAAERVKSIDVNGYAILLRRLLEIVCINRNATGKTLALMIRDLAAKGEIPEKLVKVAEGLKNLGNLGAHATEGELSEEEIPILKSLTSAILEYVYSANHLATLAENRLNARKQYK